ncbi:MAG: hypothetical protein ACE5HD_04450 [Acidobacteriota bacterium]
MSAAGTSFHRSVLVVEDEELYLRALVMDFEGRGYRVTACRDLESGESAYREMISRGSGLLLVIDLIQPGENGGYLGGLDLLRRLRPGPGVEVVVLADNEAAWLQRAVSSLGAARLVRKPDLRRTAPEHLDRAVQAFLADLSQQPREEDRPLPAPVSDIGEAGLLLGALEDLRRAPDRASVLLVAMRRAADMASRGILFDVEGDHLRSLGGFGLGDGMDAATRDRILELDQDTLPGRAFWSARLQRARRGDLAALMPDPPMPLPEEAVALPIIGPEGVAAVLYADTGGGEAPFKGLPVLSAMADAVSLALEGVQGRSG